jgi:D-amino peptidase
MKLFISTDIEGICGITTWEETRPGHALYPRACRQMSLEVRAALDGAREAGVDQIVVKDSHGPAMNIDPDLLDYETELIRGWAGSPEYMMHGIDGSFDICAFVGYHSPASLNRNPLAHTGNADSVNRMLLNGKLTSELVNGVYTAAYFGVPSIFVSGDAGLCEHAKENFPFMETVAVKDGGLGYTKNLSPQKAIDLIKEGMKKAVANKAVSCMPVLPETFELQIDFKGSLLTKKAAHYPGAALDNCTAYYKSGSFLEIARFIAYVI